MGYGSKYSDYHYDYSNWNEPIVKPIVTAESIRNKINAAIDRLDERINKANQEIGELITGGSAATSPAVTQSIVNLRALENERKGLRTALNYTS